MRILYPSVILDFLTSKCSSQGNNNNKKDDH